MPSRHSFLNLALQLPLGLGLPLMLLVFLLAPIEAAAQAPGGGAAVSGAARISEEVRTLPTYPFSEPNPVPILTRDPRLYPYHAFEGYAVVSEPRPWKVVKLENDLVEVFVLPEVGGKVWGAVVKATGHEFIYRNEVMKFRNIALRGPWTSGGIEFNFGVIGHAPSTATPVDYLLRENPDGSVSCWVGSMDLPSRTVWRVEIRLPSDEAAFETNVFWYNPTPLEQPYYNWMTAAAFARPDLEMAMPGDAYLHHSGDAEAWPVDDAGRYLPLYANNTFESHKSFHVVGELKDSFGGYYHDGGWGFGHWARYEEMPGQKLWLWSLARDGGVWEDLLTDTDGQYVEFQAGRLFVQYSPGSQVNPITQAGFDPLSASRWTERWFPVEEIGGLTEASAHGALHAAAEGGRLAIGVSAFRAVEDTLKVWAGRGESASAVSRARTGTAPGTLPGTAFARPDSAHGELVAAIPLRLSALEPFRTEVPIPPGAHYRVQLPALGLDHASDPRDRRLGRSFETPPDAWSSLTEVDRQVFQARELMKARRYPQARVLFEQALAREPRHREALLAVAELDYRRGYMDAALGHARRVLELDAYDPAANFRAGLAYRAMNMVADARDAFGWAARSTAFRAAAYVQLAELGVMEGELGFSQGEYPEAVRYARLALDHDRASVPAWQALAIVGRKTGDGALVREARDALLALDPLHHFTAAETFLRVRDPESERAFLATLGGELPDQTLLELAIRYANLGLKGDALAILEAGEAGGVSRGPGVDSAGGPAAVLGPGSIGGPSPRAGANPVHRAWMAWLADDPSRLADVGPPAFAFPFRTETLSVLMVAAANDRSWIWRYLVALNSWALDRVPEEVLPALVALGQTPDFAPFYATRAHLLASTGSGDPEPDLRWAVALEPTTRVYHVLLTRHLQEAERWEQALEAASGALERFPVDFELQLLRAKALLHLDRPKEAADILATTRVLPSEGGRESHQLWEQAHTLAALDAMDTGAWSEARAHLLAALEWPEHLGQGRPYQPEERLARLLLGRVELALGRAAAARESFAAVVEATPGLGALLGGIPLGRSVTRLDLLALPALDGMGMAVEARRLRIAWEREITELGRASELDLDGHMIRRALEGRE